MLFKSKKTLIISIVLLAVILALSVTAVTYAVWTTIATANEELSVPVDEYNPSEKYIDKPVIAVDTHVFRVSHRLRRSRL